MRPAWRQRIDTIVHRGGSMNMLVDDTHSHETLVGNPSIDRIDALGGRSPNSVGAPLFEDDFNRSDSSSLGQPWVENSETTAELTVDGQPIGPGYIELADNALTVTYVAHSGRGNPPYGYNEAPVAASIPLDE